MARRLTTGARAGPGRRWAYLGATLGGLVSTAANIAHSYVPPPGARPSWRPPTGAVIGAVFWPVALFVAVEILARIGWPAGARWWVLRLGGLLPVAVVAAVVSYRHLSALLATYGEEPLTVHIGPLAVDGLMVMATGALMATAHNRTTTEPQWRVDSPNRTPDASTPDRPAAPLQTEPQQTEPAQNRPGRVRLPAAMRDLLNEAVRQATADGRELTGEDIRRTLRVPDDMAARIVTDLRSVNGHPAT